MTENPYPIGDYSIVVWLQNAHVILILEAKEARLPAMHKKSIISLPSRKTNYTLSLHFEKTFLLLFMLLQGMFS